VLSHDTIALLDDNTPTLEVCQIVQEPDRDTPSLRTLVRLGLPPFAPWMRDSLDSYCFLAQMPVYPDTHSFVAGGPGRPPRRNPFHNSPEERIVAVAFRIGSRDHLTIVTHVRTLIAYATTTLPEENFIPWKDWGPSGTACFDRSINILDHHACVGERLATISDGSLSLFDFNSARVQNAIREVGRPSQNAAHSVVKGRVVIPRGQSFEIDIVSELPYISVEVPTPRNWKGLRHYEEGLAGFSQYIRGKVRGQTFSLHCSSGN
jgi:hypothetical protein